MIAKKLVRTTLTLPADFVEAIDRAVADGEARSRNELIVEAIARDLGRLKSEAFDASIRRMANDPEFKAEHSQIMKEFESADSETWALIPE